MRITIYWKTNDMECIKLIRDLCKLPSGMTVNGETTADAVSYTHLRAHET